MPSGLWVTDCSSSDWAWLDLGCVLEGAGTAVGTSVSSALTPVYNLLIIVAVFLVAIILIIGFAPNVKHIVPHFA
jgi:hypothetical protein